MVAHSDLCFYGSTTDRLMIERPSRTSVEQRQINVDAIPRATGHVCRLNDAEILTLDCYGTLVDRETGIVTALMPWLHDVGVTAGRGEILRAFGQAERSTLIVARETCYRDLLVHVHDVIAEFFGVRPDRKAAEEFAASIGRWPVHADVPDALAYLKEHFQLVVLTNTDHASFDHTAKALGVAFDAVYTAEDVGSYKPNSQNFAYLLNRIREAGISKRRALHVAGSLRFDHVPAKRLGMNTCWIHRGRGHPQSIAMRKRGLDVTPDFHFDSLSALVDAHRAELAAT